MLESLPNAVSSHTGQFVCEEIGREENIKLVAFRHIGSPANTSLVVPDVQGLVEFHDVYENLVMYFDEQSGDAAYFIASPSQWPEFDDYFRPWLDGGDEDDLPEWIDDCLVIGEIPRSGNYLLVPTTGPDAGKVFEFEHDGFEFIELGNNLPDFVTRMLDLDSSRLTAIASHLRFITEGEGCQWWIKELWDNRGNVVRTDV